MKVFIKSRSIRIMSAFLAIFALVIVFVGNVFAAEQDVAPSAVVESANSIIFSNIDSLEVGDSIEINITDSAGNPAVVGVERVNAEIGALKGTASSSEIKVYFTGVIINCSFYMTVSNNKCTRVYDDWILTVGGTYSNSSLSRTTTYGKLSFIFTDYLGLISGTCWLKGTVTGSNNEVSVSWSM